MQKENKCVSYNPSLGKPLTEEEFGYLWTKETTKHITGIDSVTKRGVGGGHTTESLEKYYQEVNYKPEMYAERPITICQVLETDIPGFYIYVLKVAETHNNRLKSKKGELNFLPSFRMKHVFDTDQISIDEYYEMAKRALVGTIPTHNLNSYDFEGTGKDGIPFVSRIRQVEDLSWSFVTVYSLLKEKEIDIEKGM